MKKLIADGTMGGFVKLMRIMGFDVEFVNTKNFDEVIKKAKREKRIIVTRRRKALSELSEDVEIISIAENYPQDQVRKVLELTELKPEPEMFLSRCLVCNQELENIKKEEVKDLVPPYVFKTQNEFSKCPGCGRIYWAGTHIGNMKLMVKDFYDKEVK